MKVAIIQCSYIPWRCYHKKIDKQVVYQLIRYSLVGIAIKALGGMVYIY
jgi:hypothetical protein